MWYWYCKRCDWEGTEPRETTYRALGLIHTDEVFCPECGGDWLDDGLRPTELRQWLKEYCVTFKSRYPNADELTVWNAKVDENGFIQLPANLCVSGCAQTFYVEEALSC
jgi:hypothetical protein